MRVLLGAVALIPSAKRFVWAAKQPLGNAALGLWDWTRASLSGFSEAISQCPFRGRSFNTLQASSSGSYFFIHSQGAWGSWIVIWIVCVFTQSLCKLLVIVLKQGWRLS